MRYREDRSGTNTKQLSWLGGGLAGALKLCRTNWEGVTHSQKNCQINMKPTHKAERRPDWGNYVYVFLSTKGSRASNFAGAAKPSGTKNTRRSFWTRRDSCSCSFDDLV